MIGALKCSSGTGARMLRNVTPSSPSSVTANSFDMYGGGGGAFVGHENCKGLNWSQKRFLRCLPSSTTTTTNGVVNVNAQFTVNEIENYRKRLAESSSISGNSVADRRRRSLVKGNYRKSIQSQHSYLLTSLPNPTKQQTECVAELYKIIVENGPPTIRIKNGKDNVLIKEWIGVQKELNTIKKDRIEEDKRRLQIAGQQALREMEASLRKGMNLEDLDEAIEGALCSELKDQ